MEVAITRNWNQNIITESFKIMIKRENIIILVTITTIVTVIIIIIRDILGLVQDIHLILNLEIKTKDFEEKKN